MLEKNVNAFETCDLDAVLGMPQLNALGDRHVEGVHAHVPSPVQNHP